MIVSGKKALIVMFSIAFALCLWVRMIAPKLTIKEVPSVLLSAEKPKPKPGYRTKMFPSMEEARAIAEKKIAENSQEKNIITKYEAKEDGWLFYYESEKYLNSGKAADRTVKNTPVLVHKDGSSELFTGEKTR